MSRPANHHLMPQRALIKILCVGLWLCSLHLLPTLGDAQAQSANLAPLRTGAQPFTPDIQKRLAANTIPVKAPVKRALPPQVKNWRYLPAVRNQQLNNCGAFSPSYYYKTYQEAREHGWLQPDPMVNPERVMSPGFTYPLTNKGVDEGANVYLVLETISRHGIAPWSVMPETMDYISYPGETAWRAAIPYRGDAILSFDTQTVLGQAALKEHLAQGDPAVMTALLYHDTFDSYGTPGWGTGVNSEVIYGPGNELWDWHAFTIIGYDDNKAYQIDGENKTGAFLAVNSWGPGWGVQDADVGTGGFVWFAYEYLLNPPGGSMAGPVLALEDRTAYEPYELAVFDVSIIVRSQLHMSLCAGSPDNKLSSEMEVFPYGGGAQTFSGRIVIDISDLGTFGQVFYTLFGLDTSNYLGVTVGVQTGKITHFHIEKNDGGNISSSASTDDPTALTAGTLAYVCAGPLQAASLGLEDMTTQSLMLAARDWDNNGRPDLGIVGGCLSNSKHLRFYWNTGQDAGRQEDSGAEEVALNAAALAWGDYDSDGLADLAVTGYLDYEGCTRLYRNQGPAGFADSSISLPALSFSSVAWGDYNNDGRQDLVLCGQDAQYNAFTRIYKNEGNGQFSDSGITLDQQSRAGVSWADLNNDGWLDLAVGATLYQNNGDGSFTPRLTLGNSFDNRQAWGDFDGDGLLDLAYMGYTSAYDNPDEPFRAAIYRNQGNFVFSDIGANLHAVYYGELAWADFDNDGRLDLALCGLDADGWEEQASRLYHQTSDGQFEDTGADLTPLGGGSLAWADFDTDGDVDLVLSGSAPRPSESSTFVGATVFYRNQTAQPEGLNRPNTAPSVPTGLSAQWDTDANELLLRWQACTDAETGGSAGLNYRLRVGTWSGGSDVVSPAGEVGLCGAYPHGLLEDGQPGRLLRDLTPGRYFWSVQAVDPGLAASDWSPEQMVVIGAQGILTGDVNQDGSIDVADVVRIVEMIEGNQEARLDLADLDGNGQVQTLDVRELLDRMLVRGSEQYLEVLEGLLTSSGTLCCDDYGIELEAPAGALSQPQTVRFEVASTNINYGPGAEPIAWRLRGLPLDNSAALKVRIRDLRADTSGTPFLAIGSECFSKSYGQLTTGYHTVEGRSLGNGWIEVELPAPGAWEESELQSLKEQRDKGKGDVKHPSATNWTANYDFWLVIHLLAESQWKYKGGNFSVIGPLANKAELPALAADLEEALAYYRDTLGFDVSRRDWVNYPLEVTVRDVGGKYAGDGYTYPGLSYNSISIELNKELITQREVVRLTAVHELFHAVQHLMDKRNRVSRLVSSPDLWIDEATATYMENHFASDPDFIPNLLKAYKTVSFDGYYQAEKLLGDTAQNYGYGCAPLIAHLVKRNNGDPVLIRRMYEKMQIGIKGLYALEQCAPGYPTNVWLTSYYKEIVNQSLYPGLITLVNMRSDIATTKRIITLKTATQRSAHMPQQDFYPLSAGLSFIQFDAAYPAPDSEDRLGFLLRTDEPDDFNLEALALTRTGGAAQIASLGHAATTSTGNGLKLVVNNAFQYTKSNIWLVPVVINTSDSMPYDETVASTLHFGIIRDYLNKTITAHPSGPATIYVGVDNLGWPTFTGQGEFSALDTTLLIEGYKDASVTGAIPGLNIHLWGDPLQPVEISYTATINDPQEFNGIVGDCQVACTYLGNQLYRLRKWRFTQADGAIISSELVEEGQWQDNANFTLTMNEEEEMCSFGIEMKYDYHITRAVLDTGQLLQDEDQTRVWSTAFHVFGIRD